MKKLNDIRTKKKITSTVLGATQLVILIGLLGCSHVAIIQAMNMCHPKDSYEGTIIAMCFIVLLSLVILGVMFMLGEYRIVILDNIFPMFGNDGKGIANEMEKRTAHVPVPLVPQSANLWVPINENMDFDFINWNGIVFLVADDGEITLTCGNLDYWSGDEPEWLLGDEENPAFEDITKYKLTETGRTSLLIFAGYFNLTKDAESFFRGYLSVPEVYAIDGNGRLVVTEVHNFLLIYENGFIKVLSYHEFTSDMHDDTHRSCSDIRVTHRDCNWNRTKQYLKIGVPLKYIVNLDRCYLTDCRLLFDEIENNKF